MPRWDFSCDTCKTVRELSFPNFDATKQATCPVCASSLKRLPSAGSFVLKGGCWYRDGYSSSKK